MKNVTGQLVDAWFELLDGNLTHNSIEVKVYPVSAGNAQRSHHVEIKAFSETDDSNKKSFVTKPVIVIDIVTVHGVSIDHSIVNDIDNQIRELLFPTRQHALPALTGLQITNVKADGCTYLDEDDGTKKYYRKVTRYTHRVTQI